MQVKIDQVRQVLEHTLAHHAPVAFANSLGAEDMVLTDIIARYTPQVSIFTLDTGRFHSETYDVLAQIQALYGPRLAQPIRIYHPDSGALQAYTEKHGVNAFYDSVDLRKACCHIRKLEPLQRALHGYQSWVTGLRRSQSASRADLEIVEFDTDHQMQKINPLLDWSEADVWGYLREHQVPYNKLHDQHYPSIGCAPCTRAIAKGEDIRAGRWWWEDESVKECGLHVRITSA